MARTPQTEERRRWMVQHQLATRGIGEAPVLEAMRNVPREQFVGPELVEFAYYDRALPIGEGQTISQPYVVALMIQALEVGPGDRVLEVGTGSGYAAAVLSRICAEVFTVERHPSLAEQAEQRYRELGMDNIQVLVGDGTLGWPEHAPFDAILVSAGGEEIPSALAEQLAPGGRLVMPVGPTDEPQDLRVYRRHQGEMLDVRSLGPVRFVPLIGTMRPVDPEVPPAVERRRQPRPHEGVDLIRRHAQTFDSVEGADLGGILERIGGARTVLLGEASHGTSEFYTMRARITRALIERGAVRFVAAEADWPDAAHLDRYVRCVDEGGRAPMAPFTRFPRWMWGNREVLEFLRWLRDFNQSISDPSRRIGFFGLDLYSLHTSIEAVVAYLRSVDEETATLAHDRYACLSPWERDPQTYGRLVATGRLRDCEAEVVSLLADLLDKRIRFEREDGFRYMDAVQNARLVANAEQYYRAMYQGPTASWNLRDQHMFDTLEDLLTYHGADANAVVWAHNSHLGDASATEMGAGGQHNLGQLCRQRFGRECYAVGFGTHTGTVMAAPDWGEEGRIMDVRPSLQESYEGLCHASETERFMLPLRRSEDLRRGLAGERLQRAIGVVYRPETERSSHYFHASLPRQFDEWIFFDRSEAVTPLRTGVEAGVEEDRALDTYPFAV